MNDEVNKPRGFFAAIFKFFGDLMLGVGILALIAFGAVSTYETRLKLTEENCQRKILGRDPTGLDQALFDIAVEETEPQEDHKLKGEHFAPVEDWIGWNILALTKKNCLDMLFGGKQEIETLLKDSLELKQTRSRELGRVQDDLKELREEIRKLTRHVEELRETLEDQSARSGF